MQIKNRYTGAVIYEGVCGMTVRAALEAAVSSRADLSRANLCGANLCGANLCGADLSGADLFRANLCGADLSRADLSRADLSRANLCGANLCWANLCGADLSRADLCGANLCWANLCGADLSGADLSGANLSGANLSGADLSRAKWTEKITINQRPIQLYGLEWPVIFLDAHMQIGCQLHSLHDWERFDDRTIAEMDGRSALRFWQAYKASLLALARGAGRSFEKQEA